MSELKDLVPTLESCKQIPKGYFEDSIFVWTYHIVTLRPNFRYKEMFPAPTLQEIMKKIPVNDMLLLRYGYSEAEGGWGEWDDNNRVSLIDNPADAALKQWLWLNKKKHFCKSCHGTGHLKSYCDAPDRICPMCGGTGDEE